MEILNWIWKYKMGFGNLKLDAGQRHGFFTKVVCLQGFRCHIVPAQSTFGSFVLVFSIVSKTADGKTPAMSFKTIFKWSLVTQS